MNEKGDGTHASEMSHATPTCGGSQRLAQPASCRRRSRSPRPWCSGPENRKAQTSGRGNPIPFPPKIRGKLELALPAEVHGGFRAGIRERPSGAGPNGVISPTGVQTGMWANRDATALGYHTISATFTLGGRAITLTTPGRTVRGDVHDRGPDSPHQEPHLHYNAAWLTNHMEMSALPVGESAGIGSGKVEVTVGVVVGGCYDATVSVSLRCTFDTSAFQA